MRLLFAILLIALLPFKLFAQCTGQDVRSRLTVEQQAEIENRLSGVPFTNGNHWTATRNKQIINIIGTLHLDDPRFAPITAELRPIVETADLLMVEATNEDQAALELAIATDLDLAFLNGKTLIDMLPEDDWAALSNAIAARGIPAFMAAKFRPWYLSLLLSIPACKVQEISEGQRGLDQRLLEIASDAGVPAVSLEAYTTIFEILSEKPLEEQLEELKLHIHPESSAEDATQTVIEQYFDQEHMSALETSRVISRQTAPIPTAEFDVMFDAYMDRMIRVRNENWLTVIRNSKEDKIVVAVGALHLGGKYGVLNLLHEMGYALEQQPF